MQFNYYFLKRLSQELSNHLVEAQLVYSFSQRKNEIVFEFEKNSTHFFINATLDGDISLLSFPEEFARARKNSINLFAPLKDKKVLAVRQFENERAFSIEFEDNFVLLFKLHGRLSNILLFEHKKLISIFKNSILKDKSLNLEKLDRSINQSGQAIIDAKFDLQKIFPTFDKNIKSALNTAGYEGADNGIKLTIIKGLLSELNSNNYYVVQEPDELPRLTLLKPVENNYTTYNSPIEACNAFSYFYRKTYHFITEQRKQLSLVKTEIKRSRSYIKKNQEKLNELTQGKKYNEIADILMANLQYNLKSSNKSVVRLFDFYQNEELDIKINPNLSLQDNAAHYYRKSKNQKIELEKIKENIRIKRITLDESSRKLNLILNAKNFKELKDFIPKKDKKKKEEITLPYTKQVVDGYDVLIGRNAKQNDILTLKIAKKNDLWLHAKDVPGSHVVIRSRGNDQYPKDLIEKAAQLAAWHSKRKNDTLCPVVFTLKKYVNKPKGSVPGLVRLLQEKVVLVKPIRSLE
ncbi:MAG: DUF814 domain-containing protein [Reichenbachiella sp.]